MRNLETMNYYSDHRVIAGLTSRIIEMGASRRGCVRLNMQVFMNFFEDYDDMPKLLTYALEEAERKRDEANEENDGAPSEALPSVMVNLPTKNALCPCCDGDGKVVDPSIDAGGIDFDGDDDFADAYFSGAYDMTCPECKGEKVVPEINEAALDLDQKALLKAINKAQREADEEAYERANELAWGY